MLAHDIYIQDNAANGNYDHDVAGIGRLNNFNNRHADAQGTGVLRISNPSNLGNNEFLMWGHDGAELAATETTDVPTGVEARFARVWRASERSPTGATVDVGSVTMNWDLSGLGSIDIADLRLLVDTDNDGVFNDETPISGATLNGSTYQFAGVTALVDNCRFTLGTADMVATPLPVELLYLTAELDKVGVVHLEWSTATEVDNDYFVLERSTDGIDWQELLVVDGAGDSNHVLNYSAIDTNPYTGVSYDRLVQYDFDGELEVFDAVSIRKEKLDGEEVLHVYPNPTNDLLNVYGQQLNAGNIGIFNMLGQNMLQFVDVVSQDEGGIVLDMSKLPNWIYYLKMNNIAQKIYKE